MPYGFTRPTCAPSPENRSLSMPSRSSHEPCACARSATGAATQKTTARAKTKRRSVRARDTGSGIIRAEDRAEILARARTTDGAPLAHSHAMPVAEASDGQARESSICAGDGVGRKIRTVEGLATGRPEDVANVIAANVIRSSLHLDAKVGDSARSGHLLGHDRSYRTERVSRRLAVRA